ncbi:MAG: hypothetical protein KatS3mg131_1532 [Candidatus Tectimicrobiota bacterium]|nr:MAG: hypothetical protein KatS3mg131_1532 [Candidatus Tectomicrobia bacterium]
MALPWLAVRLRRQLRRALGAAVAAAQQRGEPPRLSGAVLALLHAAVWPAYVALLAWMRRLFLPPTYADAEFAQALLGGVQVIALVLGVASLARTVLQPGGWGQHFWGIGAELCRFLRRSLVVLCFAAVLFLVPRHVVLVAPGEAQAAAGSLALARLLFLAFQAVVVLVVGVLGWRSQPLMAAVLERSRAQQGLLWRVWPLLHGLLLAGLVGIMVLDILGYRYAARFIWFRALESLSVVLTLRLLLVMLVMRLLQRAVQLLFSAGGRLGQRYADIEATAERYFTVGRKLCNALLGLLAVGIILELWGFSVSWFVTSPLGSQILKRAGIIVLAVALVAVLMQISRALVEYLLQPRTTAAGATREPGRKVKTLVPLVQTLVNVGAVFAAALVVLEQLGVATGPILAGVGIFGLAVGFASQSLIKDVINGLFILFEDSLSVGDVVMLRGIGGQVEKVTLRTVTIRDLSGNVHVIPNSSIDLVTNMTKDFSRYLLDVRVAYREDVDAVIAVLREVDEELRRDPAYGRDILEPLEVLGLDRFDESAVVIRARIKTRPLQQWRVGREFNRRMKLAFDARGIQIPFPHRTLYWGQAKDGMPPALRVMMDEPARRLD